MKFKTFRMIVVGALVATSIGVVVGVSTCCKKEDDKPVAKVEKKPEPKVEKTSEPKKPEPTTSASSEPASPNALRPMDKDILDRLAQAATTDKVKDAFPSKPYKVNLFRENGATKFNRVKIDLDRDDKWDEKWSIEDDGGDQVVKRQVAPADDEKYTDEFRLKAGAWVAKKN